MVNGTDEVKYHIHMDLSSISTQYRDFLIGKGFYHDPFEKEEGDSSSTPQHHFTRKLLKSEAGLFRSLTKEVSSVGLNDSEVKGYLEAEVVDVIPLIERFFGGIANPPFFIQTRPLTTDEKFRQSEFHARIHAERSNPSLIESLIEENTGLYTVHRKKKDGTHVLFTAQGYSGQVDELISRLKEYIESVGGASSGRIVRELVASYTFFGELDSSKDLPQIIDKVI